jgi:hypothetical protein
MALESSLEYTAQREVPISGIIWDELGDVHMSLSLSLFSFLLSTQMNPEPAIFPFFKCI